MPLKVRALIMPALNSCGVEMDMLYDVGPRDVEDFGTVLTPQVVGLDGKGRLMDHGAHGPVEDEYTLFQAVFERLLTLLGFGHRGCAFFSLTGQAAWDIHSSGMLDVMRPTAPGRYGVALLMLCAALPALADTRFRAA